VTVRLTWHEVSFAAHVGLVRHASALRAGLINGYGRDEVHAWGDHIEGACGEMAAAKALGVYWEPTVNTFRTGGDVKDWQVRTRRESHRELFVRPHDSDDAAFILVTGCVPVFEVVGWVPGHEAKREEWLKAHGGRPPAYFVPTCALHPLESLPR
jgi:hypothetical protein